MYSRGFLNSRGSADTNGDILIATNESGNPFPLSVKGTIRASDLELDNYDALTERLWKKMYETPVIEYCKWCGAANVITNPCCVQCGGPPGAP